MTSADRLHVPRAAISAAVAIFFALLVNQGVVYYVARFSLGLDLLSPWPVLLLTLAACILALLTSKIETSFIRISAASLLVCILCSATFLWSPSEQYGLNKTLLTLFVPALCIAAGFIVAREGQLRFWLASCAVLAGVAGAVLLINNHEPTSFSDSARSVIITYQNLSFVMALGAIWAVERFTTRLPRKDIWSAVCFIAFVYFVLRSGGRMGLFLVLLTVFVFVLVRTRTYRQGAVVLIACVLLVGGAAVLIESHAIDIVSSPDVPATVKRTVYYAFLQEGPTGLTSRDVFYELALDVFLQAPLVGVGWGGFPSAAGLADVAGNWPHNLLLELLAETGLAGTAAFLVFMVLILSAFFSSPGKLDDKTIVVAIFLAGFATSMVGGDWPSQRLLFFSFGAIGGVSARVFRARATGRDGIDKDRSYGRAASILNGT